MADFTLIHAGGADLSLGGGVTTYVALGGLLVGDTEANSKVSVRTAGTFSRLTFQYNGNRGASTITFQINGSSGNQTITTSGASPETVEYQDTTHSDTVSAGAMCNYKIVSGGGGNSWHGFYLECRFAATDTTTQLHIATTSESVTAASTTTYVSLAGFNDSGTSETNAQYKVAAAGTLKNLAVNCTAARATQSDFRSRINAGNGNLICSVTTAAIVEDTTHSDTIAAGDLVCYSVTTGTGADTLTWKTLKSEWNSTVGAWHLIASSSNAGASFSSGTATRVMNVGGNLTQRTTANELQSDATLWVAQVASYMSVYVSANARSGSTTNFYWRVGGADSAVVASVSASATGWVQDTTHTDTTAESDVVDFSIVTGSGTQSITWRSLGILLTGEADAIAAAVTGVEATVTLGTVTVAGVTVTVNITGVSATVTVLGQSVADSYTDATATANDPLHSSTEEGQSFTGNGKTLDSVELKLKLGVGSPSNPTISVYAHTGTYGANSTPTGSALATSAAISVGSLTSEYQWVRAVFTDSNHITLDNGTNYCWAITSGDVSNYIYMLFDSSSPTHAGNYFYKLGGWLDDDTRDVPFTVYTVDFITVLITTPVSVSGVTATVSVDTVTVSIEGEAATNVDVTGVATTVSINSVTLTYDYAVDVTGVACTVSIGTVAVTVDVSVGVTGVETPVGVGTVILGIGIDVPITGISCAINLESVTLGLGADVPVTGNSSTVSLGDVSVSRSESADVSGVVATVAVDTVAVTISVETAVSGVAASVALDSVTITATAAVDVSGETLTVAVGSAAVSTSESVEIAGVAAIVSVDSVIASSSESVDVSGVVATSALGDVAARGDCDVGVSGVAATVAVDTVAVALGSDTAVSGVTASVTLDSVSTFSDAEVTVSGVAATVALDTVTLTADATVDVSGVALTAAVDSVTVSTSESVEASVTGGVAVTVSLGGASVSTSESAEVTGLAATVSLDTVIASSSGSADVFGVVATVAVDSVITISSADVAVTGVGATAALGNVEVSRSESAEVSGVAAAAALGSVTATYDYAVEVSGVAASVLLGIVSVEGTTTIDVNATGVSSSVATGSVQGVITQALQPVADVTTDGWQSSAGGALYAVLDEDAADDADYIYSPDDPTTQEAEVAFGYGVDPQSSDGHILRIRLQAVGQDTQFDLSLVEGSTVRDSWTEAVTVAAGVVQRERTFSGLVADSIVDYGNLRLRIVARA